MYRSAEYKKFKEEQQVAEKAIETYRKDKMEKTRDRDEEKRKASVRKGECASECKWECMCIHL